MVGKGALEDYTMGAERQRTTNTKWSERTTLRCRKGGLSQEAKEPSPLKRTELRKSITKWKEGHVKDWTEMSC